VTGGDVVMGGAVAIDGVVVMGGAVAMGGVVAIDGSVVMGCNWDSVCASGVLIEEIKFSARCASPIFFSRKARWTVTVPNWVSRGTTTLGKSSVDISTPLPFNTVGVEMFDL
jgi:hypothetical protein